MSLNEGTTDSDALDAEPPAAPSGATHDQLSQVAERFAVAITPAMEEQLDPTNPHDPVALQFRPDPRELEDDAQDLPDPIGDASHSPLPGVVHRYPDRLLLTPVKVCPVYCRFCFRRETVGKSAGSLSRAELDAALGYIREHDEVWEVILSGGDPLIMSPRRLKLILSALNAIEHVRVIRIHTRVPVVSPERINQRLIDALDSSKAVYVVLHTNHAQEIGGAAERAIARLVDSGIPMLSQSVLLKGVNNDAATLEELFRKLVENRVKPYYLHHADRAAGTGHFRTTIAEGQNVMRELRGKVSGLCQPEYVLDIPGGAGKIPVGPQWIEASAPATYRVRNYRDEYADYLE